MRSIRALGLSYTRHKRAENKSPNTLRAYSAAIHRLADFTGDDLDTITRRTVADYIGERLTQVSAASVHNEYRALRTFFRWLVEEAELSASPMATLKAPRLRQTPPEVYSEVDLRKLLASCAGSSFEDRRDTAVIRLLSDTGMRRGELAGLKVNDVDLDARVCVVSGKTGTRVVPFGNLTTQALDRYERLRARRTHSERPELWLGLMGPMTANGIYQAVERRGREAGVSHTYMHRFRHTAAHRLLSVGMNEGDAMKIFGWTSRSMLDRYGASAASERAIASYRRLIA